MADENQTNLFAGKPGDEEQEDELTEGGDEAGEAEPGCEDECTPADGSDGKGKGKKGAANKAAKETQPETAAKPTPTTTSTDKFKAPFNVRYGAGFLDLAGFVDGMAYTSAEVRDVLIANGYTEFADTEPAFHRSDVSNTLVITIKGSRKGGRRHGR